jgi:hypothetical protein
MRESGELQIYGMLQVRPETKGQSSRESGKPPGSKQAFSLLHWVCRKNEPCYTTLTERMKSSAAIRIKWGAGQTALPRLYPILTMQPGETLYLFPDDTKTGAKDGAMEAVMTGDELCCITWIHRMLAAYDAAGHAITNFLTRPQASSGKPKPPAMHAWRPMRARNVPRRIIIKTR